MRLYTFTNLYLSSLQCGLQTAHVVAELFNNTNGSQLDMLEAWSYRHKTIIILNGGYSSTLKEIDAHLGQSPYPHATFHESEAALDGALTCVGVILPENVYTAAGIIRSGVDVDFDVIRHEYRIPTEENYDLVLTEWEMELIEMINRCGLAH